MKLGRYLGAIINTKASLGAKPGGVEKTLKSGAPRHPRQNTKKGQAEKRMAAAAAELQKVLG